VTLRFGGQPYDCFIPWGSVGFVKNALTSEPSDWAVTFRVEPPEEDDEPEDTVPKLRLV
jgi:hypothetical protein